MKASQVCLGMIKGFEGLRLKPYKCPSGVWTVGYGHTNGVTASWKEITKDMAENYLLADIRPIETALNKMGINFKQCQFDALVSWIFNLGIGKFNTSTMKKYIVGDFKDIEITDQMIKWVNSNGKPLVGLKRRRVSEANMFLGEERYYLDKDNNIKRK